MNKKLEKEVSNLIKKYNLNCSIQDFKDIVSWDDFWNDVVEHEKLSKDFIREFKDKINWLYVSIHQDLSENLIEEFYYDVSWPHISQYQKLSKKFIIKFRDALSPHYLAKNLKISAKLRKRIKELANKNPLDYLD